jgi:RNA polymerase sigma factor (sigma-70 family)
MDDFALLSNYVRTGSQQDFAILVNRHANWVYSVCRRHAGDYMAEDVTQAVFATLARKAPRIRQGTSISGWLFKTACYACASARKIERRRCKHEQRAAAMNPEQMPLPASPDGQEILSQLDDALARLPERDRCVILLRFYQGLSHQAAAAVLGISPAAAQRRVSRGVEKLRARLENLPFVLSAGAFEQGLQNHLVITAPPHVISASISVAGAAPSAQAALIMKGALVMKQLYTVKLFGIAACLLALTGTAVWLVLPVHAAPPAPVVTVGKSATPPAPVVKAPAVEFHILADAATANADDLKTMESRLAPGGPGPQAQPGDTIRWIKVQHPEDFDRPGSPLQTQQWNGNHYMPVLVTPDASMDQSSTPGWNFVNAYSQTTSNGTQAVAFSFDARGTSLFDDLTTRWSNFVDHQNGLRDARTSLAIIFEGKIISAPHLNSPITGGSGIITSGGKGGMRDEEMKRLIDAIDATIPPTTEPSSAAVPSAPGTP